MTDSLSLITAQVTLLDPQYTLISIPIVHYSLYLQPLLRLLFGDDHENDDAVIRWTNRHDFLNITITPIEISVICRTELAQQYVLPVEDSIRRLMNTPQTSYISEMAKEPYMVVQVDGQGLDAGERVLELTGPLAMAGISIFFISTYFSDYILVPLRAKRTVTLALEQRGFVFSQAADAFVSQLSPTLVQDRWKSDYMSSGTQDWSPINEGEPHTPVPTTPPAKDINELQSRTFRKLKTYDIRPQVDESLRLVSCAGSTESSQEIDSQLKEDLLQVLLSKCSLSSHTNTQSADFRFLSVTITAEEPVSILFERDLLPRLGKTLYGAKDEADQLVPILFDLRHLGFETTGIVGGVAGRLGDRTKRKQASANTDVSPTSAVPDLSHGVDISFLSSAKSGAVMVKASQLSIALQELEKGYEEATGSQ